MSRASDYANSVSSLYAQIGEARAREASNKGQIWSGALANIGDFVAQYPQRQAQMAEIKNRAEANQLERERAARLTEKERKEAEADQKLSELFASGQPPTISQIITAVGPERGVRIATGLKALQESAAIVDPRADFEKTQKVMRDVILGMNALPEAMRASAYPDIRNHLVQKGVIKPEDAPEAYDPAWWTSTMNYGKEPPKEATEAGFTLSPGQTRFGPTGEQIATSPAAATGTNPTEWSLISAAAKGDPEAVKALELYRRQHPNAPGAAEPLVPIIGPDGKPVLVRRSQAEGKQPASSREQGRAVTSGDANRLAELDNSLNDVAVLSKEIGTTGAGSKVGAMVPNVVTEMTGFGTSAKQRQAVIDRVKQVIGKALEGGVLRKEDEYKYTKILPTIGDPPEVAKTKLAGLHRALTSKREILVESLTDAGYDTSRFGERAPTAAPAAPATKKNPFR